MMICPINGIKLSLPWVPWPLWVPLFFRKTQQFRRGPQGGTQGEQGGQGGTQGGPGGPRGKPRGGFTDMKKS